MLTFFCPNCWNRIAEGTNRCPSCGFDLKRTAALTYPEQLVLSLRHSVPEYRLTAAQILGQLGSTAALPEFQRIIETENDYYLLREVLNALNRIDDPQARQLLKAAAQHRSALVAQFARELLTNAADL